MNALLLTRRLPAEPPTGVGPFSNDEAEFEIDIVPPKPSATVTAGTLEALQHVVATRELDALAAVLESLFVPGTLRTSTHRGALEVTVDRDGDELRATHVAL